MLLVVSDDLSINSGVIDSCLGGREYELVSDPMELPLKVGSEDLVVNLYRGSNKKFSTSLVPNMLDHLGVRYTGSDTLASAVCQDKGSCSSILSASSLNCPRGIIYDHKEGPRIVEKYELKFPLIVKPSTGNKGEGISASSVVNNLEELEAKVGDGSTEYYVEEYIRGREVSLFVFNEGSALKVLPLVEIVPGQEVVFGDSLRNSEDSKSLVKVPAFEGNITKDLTDKILGTAIRAYNVLGIRDWAQMDMIVNSSGDPVVIDVDTVPELVLSDGGVGRALISADNIKFSMIHQLLGRHNVQ